MVDCLQPMNCSHYPENFIKFSSFSIVSKVQKDKSREAKRKLEIDSLVMQRLEKMAECCAAGTRKEGGEGRETSS